MLRVLPFNYIFGQLNPSSVPNPNELFQRRPSFY